ncbi:MAG TPA: c-type cytochrome [Candidatus Acidoferrales bacterium]|nr:c-type cytochrome [Candidatus Acidoferrales bacterium]HXK02324.1 c-type cytochrome [Verrucomicrobiae bacterium]
MIWIALLLAQAAAPSQTERGEALFFDAQNGCASCHALKGKGTAVGPDLTVIGKLPPAAIAMAVRSTVTQYVQVVKLKSGESFPAMTGPKDASSVTLFDMSKTPPEKKVVAPGDVTSTAGNDAWKHPPSAAKITPEKLADILAYIKYAATGSKKAVDPSDAQ